MTRTPDTPTPAPLRLTPAETAELLAGCEGLCWWWARRVAPRGCAPDLLEEVAAELRLWFVLAASKFDPTRDRPFPPFAARIAVPQARRFVLAHRRHGVRAPGWQARSCPAFRVCSLDAPLAGRTASLADTIPGREPSPQPTEFAPNFWDDVAAAARLTPPERAALEARYRAGDTVVEVARRVGCSPQRARELLNSAHNKVRATIRTVFPSVTPAGHDT